MDICLTSLSHTSLQSMARSGRRRVRVPVCVCVHVRVCTCACARLTGGGWRGFPGEAGPARAAGGEAPTPVHGMRTRGAWRGAGRGAFPIPGRLPQPSRLHQKKIFFENGNSKRLTAGFPPTLTPQALRGGGSSQRCPSTRPPPRGSPPTAPARAGWTAPCAAPRGASGSLLRSKSTKSMTWSGCSGAEAGAAR